MRHAVFAAPRPGPLADFAAAWLGWDAEAGRAVPHPEVAALPRPVAELTATPRRYGFHGTLKPPFRLASGMDERRLAAAIAGLAARLAPVTLDALVPGRIGGFVALVPRGPVAAVASLAAATVEALDAFRAPPDAAETRRREAAGLSPRQTALLRRWGYPYVMEEFGFHMTLTGSFPDDADAVVAALAPAIGPVVPRPFRIADLVHFGEGRDGRFRVLGRHPLGG